LLLFATAELVEIAPASLIEEERFEGAKTGVELLLLQVLGDTDEGLLHDIAGLIVAQAGFACDVEDEA